MARNFGKAGILARNRRASFDAASTNQIHLGAALQVALRFRVALRFSREKPYLARKAAQTARLTDVINQLAGSGAGRSAGADEYHLR